MEWYQAFTSSIKAGIDKLNKYFPRKLTQQRLQRFKPHLFAIFLDPRFKPTPFQRGGVLYFQNTTENEVCRLLKAEFLQ